MNAVIYLDVPDWQIGQEVTVYFPDTMMKRGKCELLKDQEDSKVDKVIKALEALYDSMHENQCYACSHEFIELAEKFGTEIVADAIEALKAQQEEVEPHHKCIGETCSIIKENHIRYCPWCGRKIKRDY